MAIDMEIFRQTYLEESFEGLDLMESGLLNLAPGTPDSDEINAIFRAAHSIKGGSGTFGFSEIANFTHVVETLLDEMRSNKRPVTQEATQTLLASVDCLRDMLTRLQDRQPLDTAHSDEVQAKLEAILNGGTSAVRAPSVSASQNQPSRVAGWEIEFHPAMHLLQTGNEPVRMFKELNSLGKLELTLNTQALPEFDQLDPESSYCAWNIALRGDEIPLEEITEVFEWVEDDCITLKIRPQKSHVPEVKTTTQIPHDDPSPMEAALDNATTMLASRAEPTPSSANRAPANSSMNQTSSSIRVDISKVDNLVNLVGEMVITQSMLNQIGKDFDASRIEKLMEGLNHLERHTRDLQESVMGIRMLPISFVFNRLPRIMHDTSAKLGKQVELEMNGENTELDKTVLEKLGDPLVHIVRNSVDHGIEMPEVRLAAGKPAMGRVKLSAFHQGGNIVIQIVDDGAGLNRERIMAKAVSNGLMPAGATLSDAEIYDLIFQPGFSTAEAVTDISGRGVGMDVVRKNIKSLGGQIEIQSFTGQGSTITIRLPLTLAILDGQLSKVANQTYIFPVLSIVESIQAEKAHMKAIAGHSEVYKLRDEYIPIIRLHQAFGIASAVEDLTQGLLVVVENNGRKAAVLVDRLEGQQQVVIKSLETNFRKVEGLSGATILGDGTVAMILDVAEIIEQHIDFETFNQFAS
jgi:two-component system chemotaxis sensor kinase CheA